MGGQLLTALEGLCLVGHFRAAPRVVSVPQKRSRVKETTCHTTESVSVCVGVYVPPLTCGIGVRPPAPHQRPMADAISILSWVRINVCASEGHRRHGGMRIMGWVFSVCRTCRMKEVNICVHANSLTCTPRPLTREAFWRPKDYQAPTRAPTHAHTSGTQWRRHTKDTHLLSPGHHHSGG